MKFQTNEGITDADLAYTAYGATLEELFTNSAEALMHSMLSNPETLGGSQQVNIRLEHDEADILLYKFLNEIVYYKDAERLLLRPEKVEIRHDQNSYSLACTARGEKIDNRHDFIVDIKAVTLHHLNLRREGNLFLADFVLDV